jgi:fucose 4-O-acetylase-like acetyltransferase
VGHIFASFKTTNEAGENIRYWIYTFHMPAFVFISGFWAKRYCKNGQVRGEKVAILATYYLIFQVVLFFLCRCFKGEEAVFSLFIPRVGLWYLLSIIAYYLFVPIVEKLPPYIVIPIFVALGLFIGIEQSSDTFFSINRTFVFAPFFFAGYYLSSNAVEKMKKLKLRFLYGAVAIALSIVMWNIEDMKLKSSVFYGKDNYTDLELQYGDGVFQRFYGYIIALLMIVGILFIMPKCKTFFSYIGRNSLQIYLLHLLIIDVFFSNREYFSFIVIESNLDTLIAILVGTAITLLLSIHIFGYPFKWIRKGVLALYSIGSKDKQKQ